MNQLRSCTPNQFIFHQVVLVRVRSPEIRMCVCDLKYVIRFSSNVKRIQGAKNKEMIWNAEEYFIYLEIYT